MSDSDSTNENAEGDDANVRFTFPPAEGVSDAYESCSYESSIINTPDAVPGPSTDQHIAESPSTNESSVINTSDAVPGPNTDPLIAGPSTSNLKVTGSTNRRVNLYVSEIKAQWSFFKIFTLLDTIPQCVQFAEERGLVPIQKYCYHHKKPMSVESGGTFGIFRCRRPRCPAKSVARASGTWFEDARLPITQIFKLMHCFGHNLSYEHAKIECCTTDTDTALSSSTIADWYNYCREAIVVSQIENSPTLAKIGGPGIVVQIDESKFGKRKYNRGRPIRGHWVIGMIADKTDDLRVEVCPENLRTSEVLIPLIEKHVEKGSIIHTDFWKAYECLPDYGYEHKRCNHSDPENKFVAPDGTHTQRIESHWRVLKNRFHKDNFKGNFTDWLLEYTWRRYVSLNHLDRFEELLKCIKRVYNFK